MESMTFSSNIEKLTGLTYANDFKNKIKMALNSDRQQNEDWDMDDMEKENDSGVLPPGFSPSTPDVSTPTFSTPQFIKDFLPTTPDYPPLASPLYAPTTPDYAPPASPLYAPTTPDYPPPASPLYAPATPDYAPPLPATPEDFEIGQLVYYRGDKNNPPVQWSIDKIGTDIITITNEIGGLEVVSRAELYTDLPSAPPPAIAPTQQITGGGFQQQQSPMMGGGGGIDFRPIMIFGGNPDDATSKLLASQSQQQPPPPQSILDGGTGMPDFSKLVIKKQE
jgi:hypothetical protein